MIGVNLLINFFLDIRFVFKNFGFENYIEY